MKLHSFINNIASLCTPTMARARANRLRPGFVCGLLALGLAGSAQAANIALEGSGTMGFNDAIDTDAGTQYFQAGVLAHINDGLLGTRVDNWSNGADGGQNISFVGVLWPSPRFEQVTKLTLTLATFWDGGWFGYSYYGPGSGGSIYAVSDLLEPTVQITTDGGATWTTIDHTSDYMTALDGHGIGGTGGVNPTSATAVFTLAAPATQINGIRIIGENGGSAGADANGFLGVFELIVEGVAGDSDGDGMPDDWELANGLTVGVNDADGDLDGDGLSNIDEFEANTKANQGDTDADGLSDGHEVKTSLTNPLEADTDGDGLSDGAEVTTHKTNPLLADTDADGLSDGAEVNTHNTKPLVKDTDADGFSDGIEVGQGTDPRNPASYPSNAALIGTGIMGVNDAIDTDAGTPRFNAGVAAYINDGNLATRVDTWFGGNDQICSFVGVTWPIALGTQIKSVTLTLATFTDGGWFGPNGWGPGAGGFLDGALLLEPTIQVLTAGSTEWTTVSATSDYLLALDGHGIGGGANPNPSSVTADFTLDTPIAGATGIRIIGENGGNAGSDANGFIGIFEMVVTAGIANDSDNDGMDDDWERLHGLQVGVNDSTADPDADALSNIQEFAANTNPKKADTDDDGLTDGEEMGTHNTNPLVADTDGDGLTDGREVKTVGSNPLVADTDGDGLTDGQEADVHHCDPTKPDTDGDGYNDGIEVALGSDPNSAASQPREVAVLGQAILGVKEPGDGGLETPYANSGVFANINDGNLLTRVDTYGGGSAPTASYVGILWNQPVTAPVTRLKLSLAVFFDGGWFGPNNVGPGSGGVLSPNYLLEPAVQVSTDHGATWTTVAHTSDYLTGLDGHPLPAVDFGAPTTAQATFTLTEPRSNINGIRLLGSEGGTASLGFLGVFELSVEVERPAAGVTIVSVAKTGGQFRFEFDTQAGANYVVEFRDSIATGAWQKLTTVAGDGTRKQVTDAAGATQRFYRVATQ
ncbi:MAG TPA: hypothetical protein P5525_15625 [Candidatus Paceibacterota bacterium]|nr:hypothetical protein [Candidatus Paceibacterota bacterium]